MMECKNKPFGCEKTEKMYLCNCGYWFCYECIADEQYDARGKCSDCFNRLFAHNKDMSRGSGNI